MNVMGEQKYLDGVPIVKDKLQEILKIIRNFQALYY